VGYEKKEVKTSEDLIKAMDEEETFFTFRPAMVNTVMKASIDDDTWYGYNFS
jgi:hypothetical protein